MSSEDLELIENRPSLASTADSDQSTDDNLIKFKVNPVIVDLFENFSSEVQEIYQSLPERLSSLLELLEGEIDPVNVREYKSFSSTPVSLISLRRSELFRRRTVV
jgi:replication fork clamp-binding protein CrfC